MEPELSVVPPYPFSLKPEDIHIEEIAHSLALTCRFQGHLRGFEPYSVAQHSVLVAMNVPPEMALAGLLHDATEAYCGDMIRPIKRKMPDYCHLEDLIWEVIAARYSLPLVLPPEIKVADTRMLQTERRDLLAPHRWRWMEDQVADPTALPYDFHIDVWSPRLAFTRFMTNFYRLSGETA